jgi:hypothetical protein
VPHIKYYSDDQVKKNEIFEACSTYEKKVLRGLWWGNPRARDNL